MPEAFIYDHVRTPRGRGKADGSLHEVTALSLATVPLQALKERNNLGEDVVDDVILGVVDPVGEAGSDIARFAALKSGLGETVPGVQISRFCASGLDAVNFAAAQIMSGQHELVIGGGAESMSRVGIGASGGAWPMDPSMAVPAYFMPQGISADLIATKYGFSRDDVDAYAVQSQQRAANLVEQLIECHPAAKGDIEDPARLGQRWRGGRQQIRLNDIGHVNEVASRLAIPIDIHRLALEHGGDPEGNYRGVGAARVLPRAKNIEVAQARELHAIALCENARVGLADGLGGRVGRKQTTGACLDLDRAGLVAIDRTG